MRFNRLLWENYSMPTIACAGILGMARGPAMRRLRRCRVLIQINTALSLMA